MRPAHAIAGHGAKGTFASRATAETNLSLLRREEQLRAWMLRGLGGDIRCHVALLSSIRPMLAAFFRRRVGADAEDLVQEVLMAVHERRSSYDRARPFIPWLFAIARNELIDHFRRSRHEPMDGLEDDLSDERFEPSSNARIDVTALLATLPQKQARAIRDTRLHGMSAAEAARGAGIGESDVRVSAHRGIKALRERVARSVP